MLKLLFVNFFARKIQFKTTSRTDPSLKFGWPRTTRILAAMNVSGIRQTAARE
jgi:hypothetical protein